VTFFPFDQQQCRLKFGSWTYEQGQVRMDMDQGQVRMDRDRCIWTGTGVYGHGQGYLDRDLGHHMRMNRERCV